MAKIDDEVKEAVERIDEEIKNLEEQKKLIQSLDFNGKVSEGEWHNICETYLRSSDCMSRLVQNIFPSATNIIHSANYVNFDLYGFACAIPTSRARGIEVNVDWFRDLKFAGEMMKEPEPEFFQNLRKYYAAVDAHASVMDLARLSVDRPDSFGKLKLLWIYMNRRKYLAEDRESFERDVKADKEKKKRYEKKYRLACENDLVVFRTKVLPELRAFSPNVRELNSEMVGENDIISEIENFSCVGCKETEKEDV